MPCHVSYKLKIFITEETMKAQHVVFPLHNFHSFHSPPHLSSYPHDTVRDSNDKEQGLCGCECTVERVYPQNRY